MPKKVLLIEYEPRYVERVRNLLAPLQHTVTESHDGEAGLAAFSSSKFDMILLSGMLPRLPSAEVIREIRKKGGATAPPIILMMSGYRGDNRKADAQKVGAFDILARPFTDEDFLGTVKEALELTDIGSKTMRIDAAQLAAAAGTPLTSSDIFSDVLDELVGDSGRAKPAAPPAASPAPAPPPAAVPPVAPPVAPAAAVTPAPPPRPAGDDMEKRLRDTLSGLNLGAKTGAGAAPRPAASQAAPAAPSAPPPKPKLSSDTDVDKILSDTLSGITIKPRTQTGVTPPPVGTSAPRPTPTPTMTMPPRRREEPAAAVPSSGPDRFGQYEILERIASGGMAELYKAKRTGVEGFQKIVAIKKILPHLADDEEFITMFADEAKLAAQLNHPNIIHIYDLGKIQAGGYFIAMEYVDGRDLRAIQNSGRELGVPLPVSLAVYIASKVASALDYAHRRRDADGHDLNIVHRDVSPQNILISYEGDIKLCDFGIAKATSKASQTQSGALKGKLQYMSPEQAWAKPIDRRSDLFSLGVVLHELLTGNRLFGADTDIQTLEKVRSADVAPPSRSNPEVPKNLDTVVLRCLAKEPDDRYANASDLLRDLDSVLYSYSPAPGSADVAIYLHRLQAEEGAVAEARAREAAAQAQAPAGAAEDATARRRKSKSAPVRRAPPPAPKAAEPAPPASAPPPRAPRQPAPAPAPPASEPTSSPEIFGSHLGRAAEERTGSRAPLFIAIGIAAAALAGFAIWKMSKSQASPVPVPAVTAPPHAVVVATEVPPPAPVATAAPAIDPKAVEAEVQRQLAAKRRELEKAAAAPAAKKAEAVEATAVPEPTSPPTEPPPTPVPTARPEPTAVPTEPPAPVPPAREVQRGDLVGPGPGVVEPVLVSVPRVAYPPLAKERKIAGKVVVLVQVDENGRVTEARVQQGLAGQDSVNAAVLAAVRNARFDAATKNGIPVKMWRPVVVEVKP